MPAAQAVQIVSFGPLKPNRIEIDAPAALAIIIGTRNGETRRSPFSSRICDLFLEGLDAAHPGAEDRADS